MAEEVRGVTVGGGIDLCHPFAEAVQRGSLKIPDRRTFKESGAKGDRWTGGDTSMRELGGVEVKMRGSRCF